MRMCLLNMNDGRPSVGGCCADCQPQASCPAVNAAVLPPAALDPSPAEGPPLLDGRPFTLMPVLELTDAVCQQVWADTLACSGGLLTVLGSRSGMVPMPGATRRWSLCRINSNDSGLLPESLSICDQRDVTNAWATQSTRSRNPHNRNSMCMRRLGQPRRAHHTQSWHPQDCEEESLSLQLTSMGNARCNSNNRLQWSRNNGTGMTLQSGDMTPSTPGSNFLVVGEPQKTRNQCQCCESTQNVYENVRNSNCPSSWRTCPVPSLPDNAPEQHFEEMQISLTPPAACEEPSQKDTSARNTNNAPRRDGICPSISRPMDDLPPSPSSSSDPDSGSSSSWSRGFIGAAQNSRDWATLKATQQKLDLCGFYYENMSMEQARHRLQFTPVGTFLLRDSAHNNYLFTLSANTPRGVTSVRIEYKNAAFRLDCDRKALSKLPSFDCVLKLIQHFVLKSKMHDKNASCVWLETTGRRDTRVLLTKPLVQNVQTLTHMCRKVIHRTASPRALAHQLKTDSPLMQLLQEYPYIV